MNTSNAKWNDTVCRRGCLSMLALALVCANGMAAQPSPSAMETDPSGWRNLLPGQKITRIQLKEIGRSGWRDLMPPADLKGWSRVPVPPGDPLGKPQWSLDPSGAMLICEGDGGHDMLLCDQEFGDIVFHCEFRYTKVEGKSGYNSGIYARNSKDGAIWHQAQIGDASGGYLFGETPGAEGKKQFFTTNKEVTDGRVKPAGEWNTVEITARGNTMTLWVNGAVTCEVKVCGAPRGLVGLEGEGYRIEFRNLKVKALK